VAAGFSFVLGMCGDRRNLNSDLAVLDVGELRVSGPARAGESTDVSGELASRAPAESDHAYVQATLRGDLHAFEALVERHRDVVFRVASRIAGRADAEDVSQDAFLRAFHRLERFRADASFRAWLLQITHNAAVDHLTRRRPEPVDDTGEHREGPEREVMRLPAERLESRERIARLETKLRGLSPEHRAVLVLRDVEGLSYEEIAEITEAPLGTVKTRLFRARRDLIEMLRTNTYDWELPA
jgi:RNA polymerase sigma-70 factor, ECF subfamily